MNKYNLLVVKNRYTGVFDIKKYAVDWFLTYANLDVEVNVIETDFDVTTREISNATFQGVIPGTDIISKLRTVVPENKYNAVIFLYGNKLDGIRVSETEGTLYPDTEIIFTHIGDDNGRTENHEMFHAFFIKCHKLGINVVDNMDTYLKDSDLTVNNIIDTNREIALQTLKPYWKQICTFRDPQLSGSIPSPILPEVTLTRKPSTLKETIGEWRTNDGKFGCFSLELPWINNKPNISCIPTGTYIVKWTYSLKFPLGSYEVKNVSGRSGIRIHTGNFYKDILGCIILGSLPKDINSDGEIDLQNSGLIVPAFNKYMGKKDFILIIK